MSKPEDIPQWAWDKAEEHRKPWVASGTSIKEYVARAILAAKAEERESIAAYHDEAREGLNRLAVEYEEKGNKTQAERCIIRSSVHGIAAHAIRKREG